MLRWSRAREDVDTREHIVYIQGDEEESYRTSMQNFEHKNHKHICTTCAGQHTQREIERENRTIITSIRCDANNARWPRRGGHKREGHREKMAYNKRMLAYEFVLQILLQSHLIQFVCANVLCVCVCSVCLSSSLYTPMSRVSFCCCCISHFIHPAAGCLSCTACIGRKIALLSVAHCLF